MNGKMLAPLLILLVLAVPSSTQGQDPASSTGPQRPPVLTEMTGEDTQRIIQLNKDIEAAMGAARWAEAISKAQDIVMLRTRVLGARHYLTVDADWRVKLLRRLSALPKDDAASFLSTCESKEVARGLDSMGKYVEAQPLYELVLGNRRRLLTDNHPVTAESFEDLARNLACQRKYAEAQRLYERALDINRHTLGEGHPATVNSYVNLAGSLEARPVLSAEDERRVEDLSQGIGRLCNAGKFDEAVETARQVVGILEKSLGPDHWRTCDARRELDALPTIATMPEEGRRAIASVDRLLTETNLPQRSGRYREVELILRRVVVIQRRSRGDRDLHTAVGYEGLGTTLRKQGRYAEAQPLLQRALDIRRQALGDGHPATAASYGNVGLDLDDQGRYAEAQPLLQRALDIRREALGDGALATAGTYTNLAVNLLHQGRYAEAQPLLQRALDINRQALGENGSQTTGCYTNLGLSLDDQGRYAEAQPLLQRALDIRREALGDGHPATAASYNNLAVNLAHQGRYVEAEPLTRRALTIWLQVLGYSHPDTAKGYNVLAFALDAQGRYAEARDQWVRAARSSEAARRTAAFTGLGRAMAAMARNPLPPLVAVLARLGQPDAAWQRLEEYLGRGLLDELAAREEHRLAPRERDELRLVVAELERLNRLFEAPMLKLDQAQQRKRLEELRQRRDRVQIALGELQSRFDSKYGPLAGRVADLPEVQSALPPDAALVTWVDREPIGPNAANPGGEHWGVVVHARGAPAWVRLPGTGRHQGWTEDDTELTARVRRGPHPSPWARCPAAAAPAPAASRSAPGPAGRFAAGDGRRAPRRPPAGRPPVLGPGRRAGRGPTRARRPQDRQLCPLGHRADPAPPPTPRRLASGPAGPG